MTEDEENEAILKKIHWFSYIEYERVGFQWEEDKHGDWTDENEVLKAIRLARAEERKRIAKKLRGICGSEESVAEQIDELIDELEGKQEIKRRGETYEQAEKRLPEVWGKKGAK